MLDWFLLTLSNTPICSAPLTLDLSARGRGKGVIHSYNPPPGDDAFLTACTPSSSLITSRHRRVKISGGSFPEYGRHCAVAMQHGFDTDWLAICEQKRTKGPTFMGASLRVVNKSGGVARVSEPGPSLLVPACPARPTTSRSNVYHHIIGYAAWCPSPHGQKHRRTVR